ncbi:MAG: hypothetical protein LBI74_07090 [Synergistaceae bacterium]|nr:hypothetical protein [Synergistaceae bacterium]
MNVSSVSSSSIWEEYLERLKGQKKETAAVETKLGGASKKPDINPEALLAELEELQNDPEALKARASEMAAQVSEAAEEYLDVRGDMLKSLSADLETVASDGDLSALKEKLSRHGQNGGPAGLSGAASISASSLRAMLATEEEEDTEEDETSTLNTDRLKELLAELQTLIANIDEENESSAEASGKYNLAPDKLLAELEALEDDPEKLKARAAEMAEQISASAKNRPAKFSHALNELVSDLKEVSESGDLSSIKKKLERGQNSLAETDNDVSISPSAIFSKYRNLRDSVSETSSNSANVIEDTAEEEGRVSGDELIASIRSNLSNRLKELYSQSQITYPSVSMSA